MAENTSPKISIIVPVYKVEQYLRRCLDSIASQTFTDWECILIDDGSPDNSGAICDAYAARDARFRVIHQENKGVSAARNAGLDAARGEWIGFVDSDDWVEAEMYETLLSKALATGSQICGCDVFKECQTYHEEIKVPICGDEKSNINELLYRKTRGWLWIKIFHSSLFNTAHKIRFDEEISFCEDEIVLVKLYSSCSVASYVSKPLYHYNLENDSSITHVFTKMLVCQEVRVISKIENFLVENKLGDIFANAFFTYKALLKYKAIMECAVCDSEILSLFGDVKLSSCESLPLLKRLCIWCAENNFILLIYFFRILRTMKNQAKSKVGRL